MRSDALTLLVAHDDDALEAPVQWALGELTRVAGGRGLAVRTAESLDLAPNDALRILVGGPERPEVRRILDQAGIALPEAAEALATAWGEDRGRPVLAVTGRDARGLVYALLDLADRIAHAPDPGAALLAVPPLAERPANPVRGIARPFESDVEDRVWFYDRGFWRRYLTLLATQRFNRFSLTLGLGYDFARGVRDGYFYFPYPFLVAVPGYAVRAAGLSERERERNLATLRFIGEEAALRGLHFQLGLWTHTHVWADSAEANHPILGLTPETHAPYCRDALRALLRACPAISGLTLRVHGESGVPEGRHAFWRTVLEGVAGCGRTVELDLHSKGVGTEVIEVALSTGMPVVLSAKYWAEHMGLPYHQAAIRALERRRERWTNALADLMAESEGPRRFTRYGYADFLRTDRRYGVMFRLWPGTQRVLLWGDPRVAAGYGRASHMCGALGVEIFEPLAFKGRMGSGTAGGHDPYADPSLWRGGNAWEKYLYTYRVWGRCLYNPDTAGEVFARHLRREFGDAGEAFGRALGLAGRILPLLTTAYLPAAANHRFWAELYTLVPVAADGPPAVHNDTPAPRVAGNVSPADPALFSSPNEFALELASGRPSGRYSPWDAAAWLDGLADAAGQALAEARGRAADPEARACRAWSLDITALCGLGRFYAGLLRTAVLHGLHERTGDRVFLERAVAAYRGAREHWRAVAELTSGPYRADIAFGQFADMRGHWTDRLPRLDQDLAALEALLARTPADAGRAAAAAGLEARLSAPPVPHSRKAALVRHTPPPGFRPGEALEVVLDAAGGLPVGGAWLHYRHVNQAEDYVRVEMSRGERGASAEIPAAYTDAPHPLLYFFEVQDGEQRWLYPGFEDDLCNQPYFVLMPEGAAAAAPAPARKA